MRLGIAINPFFAISPFPSSHPSPLHPSLLRGHAPVLFVILVLFRLQGPLALACGLTGAVQGTAMHGPSSDVLGLLEQEESHHFSQVL